MLQDLRYALRRLRRAPGFVFVATLLIAISLGAGTIIFGLVDTLLLRTLPVRDPESLVQLFEIRPNLPPQENIAEDVRELIAAESTTLTDVMGETEVTTSLEQDAGAFQVSVGLVTANYFDGLGVGPVLGRNPVRADDAEGNRLAWLSYRAWARYFVKDPSVVNRTVRLGGRPYRIVGVLPEGFNGTSLDSGPDLRTLLVNRSDFSEVRISGARQTKILARIRQGESLDSAKSETEAIWNNFRADFIAGGGVVGPFDRDLSVELRSIARGTSRVREQFQGTLLLLFGGAVLLLVMVSLNVGGMILARIVRSRKDAAVRRAIGATRARIIRQWTTESVLVAAIGGIGSLVLATVALPPLVGWLSSVIGFAGVGRAPTLDVSVDIRIVTYGVTGILCVGIVAGAIPTVWWTRKDSYETLKAAPDDRENRRIQSILSIVQIAVSTTLLLGGGLLVHSLENLNAVDAGFDRNSLVRFAFDPRLADYDGPTTTAFQRRLLEETANLPGVESTALTSTPVMQGIGVVMVVARPGQPVADGAWNTNINRVSSAYFETMGMKLLSGTIFDDRPISADEPTPVVVNEAFVDRVFPNESPMGDVFDVGVEFKTAMYRIVGVVSDANYRTLREFDPPIFYANSLTAVGQSGGAFSLVVRTASPERLVAPVRTLVRSIDPAMPVVEAVTMPEEVGRSLWRERLATSLASGFGIVGLAVAAIGLYAILAQYVAGRRREIGLRLALGATKADIVRLVAGRIALVMALGLLAGLAVHVAVGRWLGGLLYGVALLDPVVLVFAAAALFLVSLFAGAVPAYRAMSLDPMSALRDD